MTHPYANAQGNNSVIYNYGVNTPRGKSKRPWLTDLMDQLDRFANNGFVYRLYGDMGKSILSYKLVNGKNKTQAMISKKNSKLFIETMTRHLPDPELYIKPGFNVDGSAQFEETDDGLEAAALFMLKTMDIDNEYSTGKVTKVKVYPDVTDIPWTFVGGQISSVQQILLPAGSMLRVGVENDSAFHNVTMENAFGKRVLPAKCFVMDPVSGKIDTLHSDDFPSYFSLVKH